MRSVVVTGVGTVEVRDVPEPHAQAGEIRIKVAGAGPNYADLRIIGGGNIGNGIGLELAGIVDEIGPGVENAQLGTAVATIHIPWGKPGSASEYVVVPATHAAKIPDGLDILDAATVTLNSLTAAQLLAGASTGSLLVTGAAGGVGGYGVALAARAGWEVTALARATDTEFLRRAGAARVITALEDGFDAVLDTALLNEAAVKAVRDGGTYLGVYPGAEPPSERGIVVTSTMVEPDGVAAQEMLALTAKGVLEARRAGTVPFEETKVAYEALVMGGQRGRWVLTA
ncbi:zinc-binding dehydrogenase [Kibdelosporangium philippinense]|uniref:Zinc-binding dehydrogenase n=2 Tax=Kibdelosporangium philippinense TaxID=211113 RepID=A0ABS8ZJY2_9PSEU|nr:zinc-binding dehydrogenase [Kibdelosporangium philippinense]MCE7007792.1 zinc-binding dehydrogenase [Kibdelosporangium philippinense]